MSNNKFKENMKSKFLIGLLIAFMGMVSLSSCDPTVSLKIMDGKSPEVFKKYRKQLDDVITGTLLNYVKDAFRIQLNSFTTDYIVSHRDSIEKSIEKHLSEAL